MKKLVNQPQKSDQSLEDIMRKDAKMGGRGELIAVIAIVMAAISLGLSLLRLLTTII